MDLGKVIWITGLSSAGKTSVSKIVVEKMRNLTVYYSARQFVYSTI